VYSTCFEQQIVHPQEDLHMQFCGISYMNPFKQSGRCQYVSDTSCHRPDCWYWYMKEMPSNCTCKPSWGWTLGCSKHVRHCNWIKTL